jgi:hypothetical protein
VSSIVLSPSSRRSTSGRTPSNLSPLRSDPIYFPAYNATLSGNRDPLPYTSPTPLSNVTGTFSVYFTSTNTSVANDACSALPSSTPDLSNSVVVVQRGTCDFTVKIKNVAAKGAYVCAATSFLPPLPDARHLLSTLVVRRSSSTTALGR